jgi:hypothetical protein
MRDSDFSQYADAPLYFRYSQVPGPAGKKKGSLPPQGGEVRFIKITPAVHRLRLVTVGVIFMVTVLEPF